MHIRLFYYVMPRHHVQHAQNVGPILLKRNEKIAHVMPHVTACAVTSCMHRAARARRQADCPNYMWRTRNYLWTCRLHKPNYIYQN